MKKLLAFILILPGFAFAGVNSFSCQAEHIYEMDNDSGELVETGSEGSVVLALNANYPFRVSKTTGTIVGQTISTTHSVLGHPLALNQGLNDPRYRAPEEEDIQFATKVKGIDRGGIYSKIYLRRLVNCLALRRFGHDTHSLAAKY
jgi:hypothetical protein